MQYKGGKGQSGVPQALINLMPPHQRYFEGCLGSGRILQIKKPAPGGNWGIEVDSGVIGKYGVMATDVWKECNHQARLNLVNVDVIAFLKCFPFARRDLIYLDPPYLFSTRSHKKPIYRFEFTEAQHLELVTLITKLPAYIMISGYESEMYNDVLVAWRKSHFNCVDHRGKVHRETVWLNFPEPRELHDYRFLGNNYRDRYNIKKKIRRSERRLEGMSSQERYAMMAALQNFLYQDLITEKGGARSQTSFLPGQGTDDGLRDSSPHR